MTQENGFLIPITGLGLQTLEEGSLDALTRTSDYLPQIRVYGSSNEVVKQGDFPMGHFGLYFSKDNLVDLGEQFDCLVIDGRPRACSVGSETPVNFYGVFNPETKQWEYSKEFENIKVKAFSKDNQGYLCGLEYLLWLPGMNKFALFLMGNPTLRRESSKVMAQQGKAATFKIRFIKGSKYSWHGASCFPCSTPFNLPDDINEEIKEQVEKFKNPEASQVELAPKEEHER